MCKERILQRQDLLNDMINSILVDHSFPIPVDDAHVHRPCAQIHSAVRFVLGGIKLHGPPSKKMCRTGPPFFLLF